MIEPRQLSVMQKLFIEAYVGDPVEACKIAGYKGTDSYLRQKGIQLLSDPWIVERIKERSKYMMKAHKVIATREERQSFWTKIMYNEDPNHREGESGFDRNGNPLPPEAKPNIPIQQRLNASELLGKSEADFIDVKIQGSDSLAEIIMASYKKIDKDNDLSLEDIEALYTKISEDGEQPKLEDTKELQAPPEIPYNFL
jgi:hypothetical protein